MIQKTLCTPSWQFHEWFQRTHLFSNVKHSCPVLYRFAVALMMCFVLVMFMLIFDTCATVYFACTFSQTTCVTIISIFWCFGAMFFLYVIGLYRWLHFSASSFCRLCIACSLYVRQWFWCLQLLMFEDGCHGSELWALFGVVFCDEIPDLLPSRTVRDGDMVVIW